jgi:hypothetical protein
MLRSLTGYILHGNENLKNDAMTYTFDLEKQYVFSLIMMIKRAKLYDPV